MRREGRPSPSKGELPKPPAPVGSSMSVVVDDGECGRGDLCAELAGEKRRVTPDGVARGGFKDGADEGAGDLRREDDGDALGGNFARAQAAKGAACGFFADGLGRFEIGQAAGAGPPAVALHLAVGVHGQRRGGDAGVAGAVAAHEAARVGHDLAAGGGVEAAAVGVGDARVGGQGSGFAAARPLDALRAVEGVDVVVVEVQVAGNGAEFGGLGKAGEGVFFGDFGQGHGAVDKLADAVGGQVAGGSGGRAGAEKDAQAEAAGAGFLEGFDLAHADVDAELVALADDGFGVGGAGLHGQGDDVGGEGFEVEGGLVGGGRELGAWVNSNKTGWGWTFCPVSSELSLSDNFLE